MSFFSEYTEFVTTYYGNGLSFDKRVHKREMSIETYTVSCSISEGRSSHRRLKRVKVQFTQQKKGKYHNVRRWLKSF